MRRSLSPSRQFLAVLASVAFVLGCADENGKGRFVLSGKVTYDGQPVTNGTIEFLPTKGSAVKPAGAEIVNGQYQTERALGPELGNYQVVILAERPSGHKQPADEGSSELVDVPVQYIPAMYNTRTTLTTEVTGDQEGVNFELEKPQRRRRR